MKVSKILGGIAIAGCLALMFLIGFAGFKANADNAPKTPVNLIGSWHQTPGDNTPVNMAAEISNNHIQIMMSSGMIVVNGLYWDGTFDTSSHMTNSFKVDSVVMETGLSQDHFKTFNYDNGVLSYEFEMLGKDYTVHMSRGE